LFSDTELSVLRDVVSYWKRHKKLEGSGDSGLSIPETYQGAILAKVVSENGIPAAESRLLPGRGRISMRRMWFRGGDTTSDEMDIVGPTDVPLLFQNLTDAQVEHTCYNISTEQEWIEGDILLVVAMKDGHFCAIPSVGGGGTKHATIDACLGNGYYMATLSLTENRSWSLPSAGTGTSESTGTGTGTGTSNGCDVCGGVTGTGGECGELREPERASVPGDGEPIYVYDPRKLALKPGAHVIVTNTGDFVDTGEVMMYTGTGTAGDTPVMAPLYFVLTGNYKLVAIPDRFYTCCEGPPKQVIMTRCDLYIVEGSLCSGEEVECPPAGTGSP
jgi:hypothetical protein